MSHRSSDRSSYSSSRKKHYDSYSSDSDDDRDRHRSSRSSRDRHSSSRSSSRRRSRTPERDRYHSSSRSSDSSRSHRSDSSSEKSHKRKADQMGEVSAEQEQKKQKLEAWKKKLEQDNLLKKLKEEKEKLEQLKAQENTQASGLQMKVTNKKHENHDTANVFGMDDDDEPKVKEERVEDSNEEEDPLDAYMNGIHNEVAQLPNYNSNVITFDDIKTEVKEEEDDDETLHQKFIEELKKRASEEPKQAPKKTLEDEMKATSTRDDENIFKDILEDERVGIDDYIYMPQNAEEGPVNGPSILERATKTNRKDLKTVDHAKMNYPPFRKNFFILPKELQGLTDIQLRDMRRDMGHIRVRGVHCPPPIKNWSQCGLSDIVERKVKELGFLAPYPIQKQAIPCIMMGRNVIGIAKTGSGKTMAFLLPMFRHIMDQPPLEEGDGPIAMIIAPTRELAMQIYDDLVPFAKDLNLQAVCAYGGASIAEQIAALKRGAHIVVCTPGRMIDLLCANRGRVTNLLRVTYVVMDEADRMFDMGFGPQISRIIDNIRPDRQIVLFSATFPKPLEALAKKFLKDSIEILVGGRSVACDKVKQFVEIRSDDSKFLRLLALLGEWNAKGNILIFVDTQNEVGNMFKDLVGVGYGDQCASLHGGMDQIDRDDTLALFKKNGSGKTILIATSVASRGLHVENLQLVINYTVPNHYEDYVHRVGRTGRAEKEGTAYTFITPEEDKYAADLVRALKVSGNQIPPELIKMADNYEKKKKLGTVDKNFAQHSMSGYVGQSGFKFDNNELNAKKKEMVRQVKSMGLEDEDVVGDLIEEEEAEAQKALEKEGEDAGPAETLGSVFKAQMKAKDTTPVPTTAINTPGINAMGAYQMEFEINDYPQQARFKITHKDAMYDIQYTTGASITCKGIYVDPSKPAPPGERKLYLLIEAPEIEAVKSARRMILRRIEEASYQAAASGQMDFARKATGRYSVL